jgi:hypothetical protein
MPALLAKPALSGEPQNVRVLFDAPFLDVASALFGYVESLAFAKSAAVWGTGQQRVAVAAWVAPNPKDTSRGPRRRDNA